MGVYYGDKFFGFRCSLICDETTEIVYEIKFDNLDNEMVERIQELLSTYDNPKYIFHIYDSYTDTYGDVFDINYMWRLIEKKYLNEYLKSVIMENNKTKLLLEQRERCGITPYKKPV
jgi:hypothetical protein